MLDDSVTESKDQKPKGQKKKVAAKKPTARKKTAAKRPEPIPVDPLVVGMADMPSFPELRHALVSWGTGQGHQADQEIALVAREMSEKRCIFCNAPSSLTLAPGTPWDKVELCPCLERKSLGVAEYTGMMQAFGDQVVAVMKKDPEVTGDELSDFKRKYGRARLQKSHYEEFFPNWPERIPEIMELARKRKFAPSEIIYADQCACGTDFSVSVGMIVGSMNKYGAHKQMRQCRMCHDLRVAQSQDAQPDASGSETVDAPKRAEPSNKKKKQARNGLVELPAPKNDAIVVASTGDGDAQFGDVLGPALARLQEVS